MKCPWCGITVPEMPEDAMLEEQLCNQCFEQWLEEEGESITGLEDDGMDGDAASALASAGWGTDEDYNGGDYSD